MKMFKEILLYLGLEYKKEITKIIILILMLVLGNVLMFVFLKQPLLNIVSIILSLIIIYVTFNSYLTRKEKLIKNRIDEFVSVISYFEIFIKNNFNVYVSIQSLLPYCSDWLKEKLNKLLKNIDNDKSVQPFVDFAKEFNNSIIENLMISIYQMIEEGENTESISQFSLLFKNIDKNHNEEQLTKHLNALDSLNIFPLIGASSVTILLTLSVLSIVGDIINVI
jgi:hypothetical protein